MSGSTSNGSAPQGSTPAAHASPDAQLSALYQEIILDHYRRPRNKGTLEAADEQVQVAELARTYEALQRVLVDSV